MSMLRTKKHLGYLGIAFFFALFISLFAGAHPVYAMSQYSCPTGSTLQWQRTTVLVVSDWTCVSDANSSATANPVTTEVAQCADGYRQDTTTWGSAICVPSSTQGTSGILPVPPTTTSCASVLTYMTNPFTCMFRTFVSLTAAALIYISTWVLSIAGLLFNWLLYNTVIQFGTFYGTIKPAVETAWTAFRDIANILIIGIFTFIAISIILGLKEYGQKKMIAHVLIIAVMINFSLLFAKMIIDASNYTAAQIYTAAALGGTAGTQGGASAGTTETQYGIADQFMYLLGVGTAGSAFKTVNDSAEALDSGWAALGHGILVMMVVLGAAMVLFYGCFLLVSRMIMLIFLMVTASVAFASYLIPKWAGGSYGWSAWWSSLLWCAALAPILMFFLWMTLNVSYALKGTSNATLGVALSNPTTGSISALFNYLLILGLLFGTFKISSMAANKIGGFSMAKMATALPFTMSSRFLAAPLLRQTAGWLGTKYQGARLGEMKDARKQASQARRDEAEAFKNMSPMAGRYGADARKFEQLAADKLKAAKKGGIFAEGKMNLMDTPAMKAALGEVGIKGFAAGASVKDTKGYEGQQKARAEAAEKLAAKAAPSAADNEKAKTEARRVVRDQRQLAEAQLEATKRAEQTAAEQIKQAEQLPQKLAAAQQDERATQDTASQNKVAIDDALHAGTINQQQHQSQLAQENDRIKKASAIVKNIQSRIDTVEKPFTEADKALKIHTKETEKLAEEAAKTIVAAMGDSGENIAQVVGEKSGDILTRTLGSFTGANEEIGKKTRDIYKKKIQTASLTDVMAKIQADSPPPTTP